MTVTIAAPPVHPVFAAVVDFFAQHGRAARILATHTPDADGWCRGCAPSRVAHPCTLHPLAVEAEARVVTRARRDMLAAYRQRRVAS